MPTFQLLWKKNAIMVLCVLISSVLLLIILGLDPHTGLVNQEVIVGGGRAATLSSATSMAFYKTTYNTQGFLSMSPPALTILCLSHSLVAILKDMEWYGFSSSFDWHFNIFACGIFMFVLTLAAYILKLEQFRED